MVGITEIVTGEVDRMLRLIKYELRKDSILYLIIFSVLFLLEGYLLASVILENDANMIFSITLFMLCGWAGIMFLMVMGIVSFARELGSKYSYMTFMTPNSAYRIVGAKYLTLLITTVVSTAVYGGFIYLDVTVIMYKFGELKNLMDYFNAFMEMFAKISVADIVSAIVSTFLSIWVNIFLTVSFAYLATTLSYTILANKKGKVWLAIGLFVAIRIVTAIIINFLPVFNFGDSFSAMMAGSWLVYLFEFLFIIGTYFVVSVLLDKKVSL